MNKSTGKWSQKVIEKAPVLHCLTMIDPATSWFEITQISDRSSMEAANELELTWLTRYLLPTEEVCNKGCEFMGEIIRMLNEDYNVKRKMITMHNPQANSIVERVHKTVHNNLHSQQQMHEEQDFDVLHEKFAGILSAITKAVNSTVHTTLNATPTQLVFGRDAVLPVTFQADCLGIHCQQEAAPDCAKQQMGKREASPACLQC